MLKDMVFKLERERKTLRPFQEYTGFIRTIKLQDIIILSVAL